MGDVTGALISMKAYKTVFFFFRILHSVIIYHMILPSKRSELRSVSLLTESKLFLIFRQKSVMNAIVLNTL